jgi:hypothetical protein
MEVPRVGRKWGMVISSALMGVALALVRGLTVEAVKLKRSINWSIRFLLVWDSMPWSKFRSLQPVYNTADGQILVPKVRY